MEGEWVVKVEKMVQWSKCGGTTGSSAQDLGNAIVQCAYSMIQERWNSRKNYGSPHK